MLAKVVQKERAQDFQDVGNGCVVHPQGPAFLIVGDSLNHRPENVGVDLPPVETADVAQIGPRDHAETLSLHTAQTGRASFREGVGHTVYNTVVAVSLNKQNMN